MSFLSYFIQGKLMFNFKGSVNKMDLFKLFFVGSLLLLVTYVNDRKICKETDIGTMCSYSEPIFGLDYRTIQWIWLPAIFIISFIFIKIIRHLKIDEEARDLITSSLEVDNDSFENKVDSVNFSIDGVDFKRVKIIKNRKIDFLIWFTLVILLLMSIPFQFYILIPLFPILYVFYKVIMDLFKRKTDTSRYKEKKEDEKTLKFWKFGVFGLLSLYEVLNEAWKYKIFKIAVFSIWLAFFSLIIFFIIIFNI